MSHIFSEYPLLSTFLIPSGVLTVRNLVMHKITVKVRKSVHTVPLQVMIPRTAPVSWNVLTVMEIMLLSQRNAHRGREKKSAASQGRDWGVFCGGSEDCSITRCTQKWTVLCNSNIDKSTACKDTEQLCWYTNRPDLARISASQHLSIPLKKFKRNQFHLVHLPELTTYKLHLIQKPVLLLNQDLIKKRTEIPLMAKTTRPNL